jgi:hypothetical protein
LLIDGTNVHCIKLNCIQFNLLDNSIAIGFAETLSAYHKQGQLILYFGSWCGENIYQKLNSIAIELLAWPCGYYA